MDNAEKEPTLDSSKDDFSMESPGVNDTDQVPQPIETIPTSQESDFSLRMLRAEERINPDPEIDQEEQFERVLQREVANQRRTAEAALLEPRNLAKALTRTGCSQEVLVNYLESKQDVFAVENPEALAKQLMQVESNLIAPLHQKLIDNKINAEQTAETIESAREAFYGMILNQRISSEKMLGILNGEIIVKDVPGDEVDAKYKNVDIYSYVAYDEKTNKFNIFIYNNFFKEKGADKAFLLRHEFAHAAAFSIWGPKYTSFLEAAKNPHSGLESFSDTPELKEILSLLANPTIAKPFFRNYISDLIVASQSETDPKKVMELRMHAAQEIVADMTAHFLEGAQNTSSLIDFRARYFSYNSEQLFETILQTEGVSTKEELMKRYNIDPKTSTPAQIVEALSKSDKLAGLFRLSDTWQKALNNKFRNSGAALTLATRSFASPEYSTLLQQYSAPPETSDDTSAEEWSEARTTHPEEQSSGTSNPSVGSTVLDIWNMFAKTA